MIRILKIVLALSIFGCMFLPLSQCTYTPHQFVEEGAEEALKEPETETKILVISEGFSEWGFHDLWLPLTFVLPLLFAVPFHHKRRRFLVIQCLQTIYVVWLAFVIFVVVYRFYEPLYGGYILTLMCLVYTWVTIVEWAKYGKKT